MRSGLLSGRFSRERAETLPADDWRRGDRDFREPLLERNLALVERLEGLAGRLDCSLPELAVAWTLAWPGVTAAIVGARRPDQVDGWIAAPGVELSSEDLDDLRAALEETGAGSGPAQPPVEAVT
jgi:aryl-alcohol dehydrogenase-like predicted oxidoreductase